MLDNDYLKNRHSQIALDLNRQKNTDADPNTIQQIKFGGLLKNLDSNGKATNTSND